MRLLRPIPSLSYGCAENDSPETTGASFGSDASIAFFLPSLSSKSATTFSSSPSKPPAAAKNIWGGGGEEAAKSKTEGSGAVLLAHKNPMAAVVKQADIRKGDDAVLNAATIIQVTVREVEYIVRTLSMLSTTPSCCLPMVQSGVLHIFKSLLHGCNSDLARYSLALCLANMSHVKNCRAALVEVGAHEMMIALAISSKVRHPNPSRLHLTLTSS
jgi:hypothetical protein